MQKHAASIFKFDLKILYYNKDMDAKIFDRIEKKYLIAPEEERNLLKVIKKHMDKDNYFKSEVFNIYFDTPNYDLIIKSIDNPKFKQKLRARSYGGYDKVFLEIKTKMRGAEYNVGYKRRVLITRDDYKKLVKHQKTATELAKQKIETARDIQIASEVDYMIEHFNLEPKILVYYKRESYIGEQGLRITFDHDIRYRDRNLRFTSVKKDRSYFKDDHNTIMEIKAHGVMPLWLVHALNAEQVYPSRFSKIGKIYEQLRKEKNV